MLNRQSKESDQKESATDQSRALSPTISLPKGGGAIRGIGEKFSANPVTGTGSLTVPIATTPGRSGFSPQLALSYDSGASNGPFGLGWHLSLPSITRKTEKGLPQYRDAEASDTFLLAGAEDLVPSLLPAGGQWVYDVRTLTIGTDTYTMQRYRPRIEGLFARIERWTHVTTGQVHWQSISKDNLTTIYGKSPSCRIADPEDDTRTFTWLIEESFDDKGNVIRYDYKQENSDGIDQAIPQERNKLANGLSFANRYLKRIKYGNHRPRPDQGDDWRFQIVVDYGEHDSANPTVAEQRLWPCRADAFSNFRAGFEIRTYRLCQRVLMFHQFAELGDTPCLVRSTDFHYLYEKEPDNPLNPALTLLTAVTQTGYRRKTDGSGYVSRSLPPLEFGYTMGEIHDEVQVVQADSLENLPSGLDGTRYQWIDLDSEGVCGILTEQDGGWFYKRNLGNARFAPIELVATKPSLATLSAGRQEIMDLAGDGRKYLVQFGETVSGYYVRNDEAGWEPFTPFPAMPTVSFHDPNLRHVDLDGDGHADVLITEDEIFVWYPSRAREGFGPAQFIRKSGDEEKGPTLVFADGTESIYLADMTGDGLTDLVRMRNGEVSYWPNLGYGRFGAKVTMDAAPVFDHPEHFDHKRIRLADIDGSGPTDVLYLGRHGVTFWLNQAGNRWSARQQLTTFPDTDNLASVLVVDLLGTGTSCLVWSSPLPGDADRSLRYIDLLGGRKPYLLNSIKNNLGAETRLEYATSTTFYLADRAAGTPWITKLPFPVHVVERVETWDWITHHKFVTRYSYHHGYYDGEEREFRGFGIVEQVDTEQFAALQDAGSFPPGTNTTDASLYVPPVLTKTWFHNGAYFTRERIAQQYHNEYYQGDTQANLLPDTILPSGLTAQEEREACRALKGSILRQEVYAQDDSVKSPHPYSVSERAYELRLLQPLQDNRYAVFYPYPREAFDYHYERNPADPRLSHQMTLEVDEFGNVIKSAAIGYPRRATAERQPEQAQTLITYTEHRVTNTPTAVDWYRLGMPIETRTYELTGRFCRKVAFSRV